MPCLLKNFSNYSGCAKLIYQDQQIEIYEQNAKCAKKILVSGNGRCNITNKDISNSDYFSEDSSFVDFSIKQFAKISKIIF